MLAWKILKMELLRLAKNAFPAYSQDNFATALAMAMRYVVRKFCSVIFNYAGKERFYRYGFFTFFITSSVEFNKENSSLKQK